eukprot:s1495_g11.t1
MSSFPTCQVRVVRFYQSCHRKPSPSPAPPRQLPIAVGTAGLHLPTPDRSGHCRTSSASSKSHWALPDFSCDCQIEVGTAELQLRLPDRSGHSRTSAATARSQWALPNFNREPQIAVGTAGLQPELQIGMATAGLQTVYMSG